MAVETKLILATRRSARWYGDGTPQWKEGRAQRPCKTAAQAKAQRRQLIKVLRRHGKADPAALQLAALLEACTPEERCLSGACPECHRAFQRWFVASAATLLRSQDGEFSVVSIVPRKPKIAEGGL